MRCKDIPNFGPISFQGLKYLENFFLKKNLKKHLMQYHVPNMKKVIFFEKDNKKTWIERSEKQSDYYYTRKQREVELNRKGHLTKLQEGGHVDNVKYIIIKSEPEYNLTNFEASLN